MPGGGLQVSRRVFRLRLLPQCVAASTPGFNFSDLGIAGTCPNGCSGFGACANGQCKCVPTRGGSDCSVGTKHGGLSENVIVFDDCVSVCVSCLVQCPFNCRGRGKCEDGKCVCNGEWSGPDCGSRECALSFVFLISLFSSIVERQFFRPPRRDMPERLQQCWVVQRREV